MRSLVPRPWVAVSLVLIVAGVALGLAGPDVLGLAVGGLGAVLLVGAAFYAVGRSEDLDRERQRRSGRSG